MLPGLPDPIRDPARTTPPRQPGSIRRTSTINMVWPDGRDGAMELRGRARDLATRTDGRALVVDEATMVVTVGANRTIEAVELAPHRPGAATLVGARGGGGYRKVLDAALPGEQQAGTPLYYLLDDVAPATLIAGFAWSPHGIWPFRPGPVVPPEGGEAAVAAAEAPRSRGMERICAGLGPGTTSFVRMERTGNMAHNLTPTVEVADPDDPLSWHEIEPAPTVCMRRRRRVDVTPGDGTYAIDAMFRDACWGPDGRELSLHEYAITAEVDARAMVLTAVDATPRSLPFPECPFAAPFVPKLVGTPVGELRSAVIDILTGIESCTHLNDALRAMAEVPVLIEELATAERA